VNADDKLGELSSGCKFARREQLIDSLMWSKRDVICQWRFRLMMVEGDAAT